MFAFINAFLYIIGNFNDVFNEFFCWPNEGIDVGRTVSHAMITAVADLDEELDKAVAAYWAADEKLEAVRAAVPPARVDMRKARESLVEWIVKAALAKMPMNQLVIRTRLNRETIRKMLRARGIKG